MVVEVVWVDLLCPVGHRTKRRSTRRYSRRKSSSSFAVEPSSNAIRSMYCLNVERAGDMYRLYQVPAASNKRLPPGFEKVAGYRGGADVGIWPRSEEHT